GSVRSSRIRPEELRILLAQTARLGIPPRTQRNPNATQFPLPYTSSSSPFRCPPQRPCGCVPGASDLFLRPYCLLEKLAKLWIFLRGAMLLVSRFHCHHFLPPSKA